MSKSIIIQLSICLALHLLFQSCVAYRSDPVSIDLAVESGKRIRINQNEGRNLRYYKIIKEGEAYYGLKKIEHKKTVQEEIDLKNIEEIEVHSPEKSILFSALITAGIALPIIFIPSYTPSVYGFSSPN